MAVESDEEKVAFHKIQKPHATETHPSFDEDAMGTANIPEPHEVSIIDPRLAEMADRASSPDRSQLQDTATTDANYS